MYVCETSGVKCADTTAAFISAMRQFEMSNGVWQQLLDVQLRVYYLLRLCADWLVLALSDCFDGVNFR